MCISCGVPSACACVWVCVCSGFPQSHVWGMCCLCWAGGGGGGAGRQQSTKERLRQAGRQQAGGLPGRLGAHPRAASVGGSLWTWTAHALVFNHVLPPTHASLVSSLTPTTTIPHPQATLKPLCMWFSFKSNLYPSSVASIHKTSSHWVKRFPTLSHLLPPLPHPGH